MVRVFGAPNVRLPMQQGKQIPLLLESKGVRIDCMTACWYQQQRSLVQRILVTNVVLHYTGQIE